MVATWVSSFATYVAIVAQAHPQRVVSLSHLIVCEASKFGGSGWLTYSGNNSRLLHKPLYDSDYHQDMKPNNLE